MPCRQAGDAFEGVLKSGIDLGKCSSKRTTALAAADVIPKLHSRGLPIRQAIVFPFHDAFADPVPLPDSPCRNRYVLTVPTGISSIRATSSYDFSCYRIEPRLAVLGGRRSANLRRAAFPAQPFIQRAPLRLTARSVPPGKRFEASRLRP